MKTETTPILSCTPAPRGMTLPCPCCGEVGATIDVNLAADPFAEGSDALHCQDCDSNFDAGHVRLFIQRWSRVLAWLESMPGEE